MPAMFPFAAAVLAAATTSLPSSNTPVSRQEAKRAIVACGLPDQRVTVQHDDTLREDVVWIGRDAAALSDATLACIARASLKVDYYVNFKDGAEQKRYNPVYARLEEAKEVANARTWMRVHHRLSTMPLPRKGEPISAYARSVEAFCGVKPGSLLIALNDHEMTLIIGALGHVTPRGLEGATVTNSQFECVMYATAAADLRSHGMMFAFIANARADSPGPDAPKGP